MAICILTKDGILSDFLCAECKGDVRAVSDKKSVRRGEPCIVDADTVAPPYPPHTVAVVARKPLDVKDGVRCLVRPLRVGCLQELFSEDDVTLSREARTLMSRGVTVTLSVPEWTLFEALYGACGRMLPRVQLLSLLGFDTEEKSGLLTVYMYRLRRSLTPLGFSLRTVRGEGYLLTKGDSQVC